MLIESGSEDVVVVNVTGDLVKGMIVPLYPFYDGGLSPYNPKFASKVDVVIHRNSDMEKFAGLERPRFAALSPVMINNASS